MCLIGKTQLLCMQCRGIGPHLLVRGKSHEFDLCQQVSSDLRIRLPMQGTQARQLQLEGFPGDGNGNPLQDSCLGNSMDRKAWWAIHGS